MIDGNLARWSLVTIGHQWGIYHSRIVGIANQSLSLRLRAAGLTNVDEGMRTCKETPFVLFYFIFSRENVHVHVVLVDYIVPSTINAAQTASEFGCILEFWTRTHSLIGARSPAVICRRRYTRTQGRKAAVSYIHPLSCADSHVRLLVDKVPSDYAFELLGLFF